VEVAEPGREFTWVVGDGLVRWSYLLEPCAEGTRLTETWHFLPAGIARFAERYGADADAQVEDRRRSAHDASRDPRGPEGGRRGGLSGPPGRRLSRPRLPAGRPDRRRRGRPGR
jgi:hypothetical protein